MISFSIRLGPAFLLRSPVGCRDSGEAVVDAHREWAPIGADRFWDLVKAGYWGLFTLKPSSVGFMDDNIRRAVSAG